MGGDYTKFTFKPQKDYAGVFKQQGRVDLDADWNELVQIFDRRWRAETIDVMGRAVVPEYTAHAFNISPTAGSFTIGLGRMYVDGLLAENHGVDPEDRFDPVLGETYSLKEVRYNDQPYLPQPLPPPLAGVAGTTDLIYLDVWQREVTYIEDPDIKEIALEGADTATRMQTVWQVGDLQAVGDHQCSDPIAAWDNLVAPSAGQLTTSVLAPPPSSDPCIISASGGYRGLENRLYRVEVHTEGGLGTAKFKWSRDDASITSAVTAISGTGPYQVTVKRIGRDQVLRFQRGDWVEVLDDYTEFQHQAGQMGSVTNIDEANQVLTVAFANAGALGGFVPNNAKRHTRIRRWDEKNGVDANGLLTVAAGPLDIEDGIQVSFSLDANITIKKFKIGDYWLFAARTTDGSVEPLQAAPPRGILHHYARLGFISWAVAGGTFADCRQFWPPSMGESCDCTVCVSADSHNSGTLTLQSAIDQVQGKGGGKVCLGPGIYKVTETVTIGPPHAIEISGHGLPSLEASEKLAFQQKPILQIGERAEDIAVEGINFVAARVTSQRSPGVVIANSLFVRVKRCVFSALEFGFTPAIGIAGFASAVEIGCNYFNNVQVGIGPAPAVQQGRPFLSNASIHDNLMRCREAAVMFSDAKIVASFSEVSFADNSVRGAIGFQLHGSGLDVAIERNLFVVTAGALSAAIVCSASQTRINNNRIMGPFSDPGRDGIVLEGTIIRGTQVVGNHIDGLSGNGILVKSGTRMMETIIAQNQLSNLGGAGIKMEFGSYAFDLDITGNSLLKIGLAANIDDLDGIELWATSFNVNICENVVEVVGPDAKVDASRLGILMALGTDVRIAGNRIADIGPLGKVNFSVGILLLDIAGRVDIVDNVVRRVSIPPANSTAPSPWSALVIGGVVSDLNVRGNLLESFRSTTHTANLAFARSCIFNDNQCFLDNPDSQTGGQGPVIVFLGAGATGAIIASNNYLEGPKGEGHLSMVLSDKVPITVLGNISSGSIMVGGASLPDPWKPLNVMNANL